MTKTFYCLAVLLCALCLLSGNRNSSHAAGDQGIVATVNDIPITSFDIDQRLRLVEILGTKQASNDVRKKVLQAMIDEIIKIAEAKKFKINATDKEIEAQMGRIAKGLKTDTSGLRRQTRIARNCHRFLEAICGRANCFCESSGRKVPSQDQGGTCGSRQEIC